MKTKILIVILGLITSLNSFAGFGSQLLKHFVKVEEAVVAQAAAGKMSLQGLEAKLTMEAAVKNAPKDLAFEGYGYSSVAKVTNNGQQGTIYSQMKAADGDIITSAIPMSEALHIPTKTRIFRVEKDIFVARNFQTGLGDIEVKQGYSTYAKKTDYTFQHYYNVKTPAIESELRTVVSSKTDAGVAVSVTLAGAKPIHAPLMLPVGFFPWAMKINSKGTQITVMASSSSDRKTLVEFIYPVTVDSEKKAIEFGQAVTRTLSAAEAKQFVMQVETIAGRKAASQPVRGMQIETSATVVQ